MKQVNSQTTNPGAKVVLDHENFHYVKVQNKDRGDWQSPIEDYMNGTDEIPAHELVSEDRAVTGSSRMSLLRIPIEVHNERMKKNEGTSRRAIKSLPNNEAGEFGEVIGGVLTVD